MSPERVLVSRSRTDMSQQQYREAEREKEARKLRELFKGRFSDDEAVELMREHGELTEAVDFVLNGDPEEVRSFIHNRNEALVAALQRDSEYVQMALSQGLEASVRLFACQTCDSYWWRKVPARKEVSKCRGCLRKYDPVPRDQEWGLAEFACNCGNVFWGSGWMNHTQSPCYNCQMLTCPTRIMPPSRPRSTKKRTDHSCTGINCYNRAVPLGVYPHPPPNDGGGGGGGVRGNRGGGDGRGRGGRRGRGRGSQGGQYAYGQGELNAGDDNGFNLCANHRQVCPHERSFRQRKVLYPSSQHISTGSTVNTFMSQGELAEDYEELQTLPQVPEGDEDE